MQNREMIPARINQLPVAEKIQIQAVNRQNKTNQVVKEIPAAAGERRVVDPRTTESYLRIDFTGGVQIRYLILKFT